jgi:glutamyl-tRNA synthetase
MMKKVRTRFAPSPTGPLHLGGIRTALYAYLFAKKHKGDFLLRIEDTDQNRSVVGAEAYIIETLKWCGILPDEGVGFGGEYGPYRQSDRKAIYKEYTQKLIDNGSAYYGFDTDEELAVWRAESAEKNNGISDAYNFSTRSAMRNSLKLSKEEVSDLLNKNTPYVVRLKVDEGEDLVFEDTIRGQVAFKKSQLDDRILLKSDGMPTYHLANVVDDYLMKITHVIRGEEWLASTPHHILLYRAFGWEADMPSFSHLPLILKPDGKGKLSKRDGDRLGFPVFGLAWTDPESKETSLGYKEKGFEPHAFINFLAMLGWNDGTEKEIFTHEELIQSFSLDRVHKAGAKFNYDKAIWYNQQFLKHVDLSHLTNYFESYTTNQGLNLSTDFIQRYCEIFRDRISFVHDLEKIGNYLYHNLETIDIDSLKKKWSPKSLDFVNDYISKLDNTAFDSSNLEELFKELLANYEMGMGQMMPVFRIALTGIMQGPSVFDTMMLLGKEESQKRFKNLEILTKEF